MAKKTVKDEVLSKEQKTKLKALGIDVTTAQDARKKLLKKLGEKEVDGVDEDPLDELIEMYKAFHEPEDEEVEEEEEMEEAEETEDDEAEEEAEEEDEDEEEEETSDNPEEEDYDELAEEEEEEEKPAAKKKAVAAPVKKSIPATSTKKPEVKKPVAKAAPKTTKKESSTTRGIAFNNEDEDHVSMIESIVEKYNSEETEVKMLKQGITVFATLDSAKKALFSFDRLKIVDGDILGDLFFNALKGKEEVEEAVEELPEDKELKNFNPNLCFISKVSLSEVDEILTEDLVSKMMDKLKLADKRAVSNRKKLEEKMGKDTKSAVAKKPEVKKSVAPVAKAAPSKEVSKVMVKKPASSATTPVKKTIIVKKK